MQEKILKRFEFSKEALARLNSWRKWLTVFAVLSLVVELLILNYLLDSIHDTNYDTLLVGIFVVLAVWDVIDYFMRCKEFSTIESNIRSNVLEIKTTGICGIFSDNSHKANSDKKFELEYNQIDRLEVKHGELHIFSSMGLIKLAIESPLEAYEMILKEVTAQEICISVVFKNISD